jgi:hypothetical protein
MRGMRRGEFGCPGAPIKHDCLADATPIDLNIVLWSKPWMAQQIAVPCNALEAICSDRTRRLLGSCRFRLH